MYALDLGLDVHVPNGDYCLFIHLPTIFNTFHFIFVSGMLVVASNDFFLLKVKLVF